MVTVEQSNCPAFPEGRKFRLNQANAAFTGMNKFYDEYEDYAVTFRLQYMEKGTIRERTCTVKPGKEWKSFADIVADGDFQLAAYLKEHIQLGIRMDEITTGYVMVLQDAEHADSLTKQKSVNDLIKMFNREYDKCANARNKLNGGEMPHKTR